MNDDVVNLVQLALAEDIGTGDITTMAVYKGNEHATARILAKDDGVIAGLELASFIYRKVHADIHLSLLKKDGDFIKKGEIALEIKGLANILLSTERIVLNFMQRMSGIATQTRQFVDAVAHTHARVLDTRKTAPGHRSTDKWAVKLGGGQNHRAGLYDMYLIKENHIAVAGGIDRAIETCLKHRNVLGSDAPIEVEVSNPEQLARVMRYPEVHVIMLDNMTLNQMTDAVKTVKGAHKLEASGNITLETAPSIAETGVDFISVGSLTHSVKALDLSMMFD